jgi:zinc transporter, ZIP family
MTERGVRAGRVRVAEAFAWGLIAASSLLLGGLLVLGLLLRRHALGLVMAFGAGVLIP